MLVGQPLQVELRLDMDPGTPGNQVPAEGLFSAGVSATFPPAAASVVAVTLPDELDTSAAEETIQPGYAGAAGVVDFFQATNGYSGATILTLDLTHAVPGTYTLTPELYFAAPMENFVDYGTGAVLDGQITNFIPSTVHVVAEPRITDAVLSAVDTMTVTCELPSNAVPASISLESADPLLGAATWNPEPGIPVTPSAPGIYEAAIPLNLATSRLYRVSTGW